MIYACICSLGRFSLKIFTFISILVVTQYVAAQEGEDPLDRLFTIQDIRVDETASRASVARERAISNAEDTAFDKLLAKLTQAEDRAQLPEISKAEKQALMSGIDVIDEQSSSRRYIATLNIRFEPSEVSSFLARYRIPHVLSAGRGVVILHGHKNGLNQFFWNSDVTITDARNGVDWVNRIRSYRFAEGNVRDRASLTYQEIAANNAEAGAADIASRYGVESALVIWSEILFDEQRALSVLKYRFGLNASELFVERQIEIPINDAAAEARTLTAMYEDILESVDAEWRSQLLVDTGIEGTFDEILVSAQTLESLTQIEQALAEVSLVKGYQILSVGLPFSSFSLSYTGREDQLILALRYAGLTLTQQKGKRLLTLRQ